MMFFSLVSCLSTHQGLTLTLAGVTGIIVSVGVTVDSYVVYFERLKDEVRTGKTVRSSLDSGFRRAFRTIIAADLVSLIGAVVLYVLAAGSVRGLRVLPRPLDAARPGPRVLLHAPVRVAARAAARRSCACPASASRPGSTFRRCGHDRRPTRRRRHRRPKTSRASRAGTGSPTSTTSAPTSSSSSTRSRWLILSRHAHRAQPRCSSVVRGLNFGIDFEGGTAWQVEMAARQDGQGRARSATSSTPLGFSDAKVSILSRSERPRASACRRRSSRTRSRRSRRRSRSTARSTEAAVQFQRTGTGGTFTFTDRRTASRRRKDGGDGRARTDAASRTRRSPSTVATSRSRSRSCPPSPVQDGRRRAREVRRARRRTTSTSRTVGPTWGHEVSQKALQGADHLLPPARACTCRSGSSGRWPRPRSSR